MKRSVFLAAGLLGGLSLSGTVRSQAPSGPHLGSAVVMQRYEAPELIGEKRAAIITKGPFVCPAGHPHEGGECVNLGFWTDHNGDMENYDPVVCGPEETCMVNPAGLVTKNGYDRRESVWHDPTGETPRSWHVWGEAAGEE